MAILIESNVDIRATFAARCTKLLTAAQISGAKFAAEACPDEKIKGTIEATEVVGTPQTTLRGKIKATGKGVYELEMVGTPFMVVGQNRIEEYFNW